ncbi:MULTISPECIES: cytochrome c oxidase subunit 3 [unclassified Rhizobium]|uniref:cytochrome c oxidase subunit 3 n=1 Tax=unclassified Rhizobium TaxID=2613769 RepID=UPI000CDF55FD|nr:MULTISPECIES: cytochrome c oxidase subunit 3 [Rhizobium]AVA23677.1 cytochrome-c oxidase subunit 3 protein [Rhizobium sp. NXC24]UWU25964.1 cytochrome c oxidase subunit 3 [Rhizobium tropici]
MKERIVLDVSKLPPHGMGTASPTWWGTCAFMLIEGSGFALAIAVYFYLMSIAPQWPTNAPAPGLIPGTSLTVILLASVVPNVLLSRWARQRDLRKVRIGLVVMSVLGAIPLVLRAFEFAVLHVRWDDNAYGSIIWTMLGLHTTHIITDLIDTLVLTCLMFTGHADNPRRFGDVEDNAMYWNFVVVAWIPLYACIYWVPRL